MSLNGLDDPKVAQAYEAAAAEAGGWFLLKYSSRDEVELLGSGQGGIPEVRKAISDYDETNPLYGFLKYRRRNVLIKYLPDGCSRLIQARVAVHFNAVCERFSPYDSQYDMAAADDLRDSKLSTACSLHAAKGSNSSSGSNGRKHLMEITEEDEEEEQQPAKRQSLIKEKEKEDDEDKENQPQTEPVTLDKDLAASPENAKFSGAEMPQFTGAEDDPSSPPDASRRLSSQSSRADVFTSYSSYSSYSLKPKVKLGPRPSLDTANTRPQTAGNFRPVSSIPAGFKLFGKGSSSGGTGSGSANKKNRDSMSGRKDSAGSLSAAGMATSPMSDVTDMSFATTTGANTLAIPEEPSVKEMMESSRPATSSGVSTKSGMTTASKAAMTPEKARLKKAMQLREKKKKAAGKSKKTPPVPAVPVAEGEDQKVESKQTEEARAGENIDEKTVQTTTDEKTEEPETAESAPQERVPMVKADSAIAIAASPVEAITKGTDVASDRTLSDSRPTSPVVGTSETEQSTQASSVSESTETAEASEVKDAGVDDEESNGSTPRPVADREQGASPTEEPVKVAEQVETSEPVEAAQATEEPKTEETVTTEAVAEAEPVKAAEVEESEETEQAIPTVAEPQATAEEGSDHKAVEALVEAVEISEAEQKEEAKTEVPVADETPKNEAPQAEAPVETPAEAPVEKSALTSEASPSAETVSAKSPDGLETTTEAPTQPQTSAEDQTLDTQETAAPSKQASISRRKAVEPIRTDLRPTSIATATDLNFSDSDSLLDELQSATVQEAKPVTVVKTPLTPAFPNLKLSTNMSSPDSGASQNQGSGESNGNGNGNGVSTTPTIATPNGSTPTSASKPTVRTVSNPVRGSNLVAPPSDVSQSSMRSLSQGAAYLHQITQQRTADPNLSKRGGNVGSGISQRIKALEMLSASSAETPGGSPGPSQPGSRPGSRPSSTFFSVKKDRVPSRSPSVVDRTNSLTRDQQRPGTAQSQAGNNANSPEAGTVRRDRSGSISNRLSMFEPEGSPGNTPRGRPETISVTAKIIRNPSSASRDPQSALDLRQSPLLVDHQIGSDSPSPSPGVEYEHQPPMSHDQAGDSDSRRSSFGLVRDFMKDGRKSISSPSTDNLPSAGHNARSPTSPPPVHQNTAFSRLSPAYGKEASDDAESPGSDKKKSRAGRLMRRLSSLSGSNSNSNARSPGGKGSPSNSASGTPTTVTEERFPSFTTKTAPQPQAQPPAPGLPADPSINMTYMGDVNVQFPDTLLWKRRNMYLDNQGFLMLSAVPQTSNAQPQRPATGVKRYHLGDFRAPYAPDVEVEELPNSVVLDLVEGSAVQVACEDRAGQMHVLKVLRDAHASYAGQ